MSDLVCEWELTPDYCEELSGNLSVALPSGMREEIKRRIKADKGFFSMALVYHPKDTTVFVPQGVTLQ